MARSSELDRLKRVTVRTRAELRRWLESHHESTESIWLVTYKKDCGKRYLPYDAIVEEALCFGWIDSLRRKLDEQRTMMLLSPRRPRSVWSKLNKERVELLIGSGLMRPPGLKKIECAQQDGSWAYLEETDSLVIPADLSQAFEQQPGSREQFHALSESMRRRLLHHLKDAKGAATRKKRILQLLEYAANQKGRPKAALEVSNKPSARSRSAG
jgi:uncharacterized protein YdeI (YjbR/CyaY-like superfamily)